MAVLEMEQARAPDECPEPTPNWSTNASVGAGPSQTPPPLSSASIAPQIVSGAARPPAGTASTTLVAHAPPNARIPAVVCGSLGMPLTELLSPAARIDCGVPVPWVAS